MKYLNKYNESIKTFDSLTDEELEEKKKWLMVELKETQEELVSINKIITKRKEAIERSHSNSLPDSIFDFNDEQLDWLLEHNHGTTSERYKIAQEYFKELTGVHQNGFNPDTNQFYFDVVTRRFFNEEEDEFVYDVNAGKSISFLGNKLKRVGGFVKFGILYSYEDTGDNILFYSDTDIRYKQKWGNHDMLNGRKKESLEEILSLVINQDLSEKDSYNDNW